MVPSHAQAGILLRPQLAIEATALTACHTGVSEGKMTVEMAPGLP